MPIVDLFRCFATSINDLFALIQTAKTPFRGPDSFNNVEDRALQKGAEYTSWNIKKADQNNKNRRHAAPDLKTV